MCRQAQLHQGHDDYQSIARREQREQEKQRADQARDAERKNREEVQFAVICISAFCMFISTYKLMHSVMQLTLIH